MQDVCIAIWRQHPATANNDMMFKVTDICGAESADGVPLKTPMDLKVDRRKAAQLFNIPIPQGNNFGTPIWWWFMKCFDDVSRASVS